jgi:Bacterial toxin 43
MRIYDLSIAKFLSVDPLTKQYPELTPYQFASNSPIDGIDLDGLEHQFYMERFKKEHWYGTAVIKAINGADALVTVLSKTAELGFELLAQPHLNNKIKPENRAAVFPLTHDQNIKTLAVGGVAAPILAVGGVIEEPSNERKWGELAATAFLYRGLLKGKAAPTEAIKEFDNLKGSGSVSGVIELNRSIKSNKAFLNGLSESARDFVYDPTTQKFAMAGKNASGLKHYGLRRIIGAEEGNVVGGRIKIGKKGEIMTSQWSGTYGQNWTPEIATKFKDFMKEQTNKTINQSGNMKFNDGTK